MGYFLRRVEKIRNAGRISLRRMERSPAEITLSQRGTGLLHVVEWSDLFFTDVAVADFRQ